MSIEEFEQNSYDSFAREISEVFERDSRRFNRALLDEEEAKG